jgi:WD40 repeat protein
VSVLSYSPDATLIAVGMRGRGGTGYIDVLDRDGGYRPWRRLRGHTAPVCALDWSSDGAILQSCCGHGSEASNGSSAAAGELLFWEMRRGTRITAPVDTDAVQQHTTWATWTSPLGYPVIGVHRSGGGGGGGAGSRKSLEGAAVVATQRSSDATLLAVADADGIVRLMQYPAASSRAPARAHAYRGHSAPVGACVFTTNDDRLLTVGAHDHALFQYRVMA